MDFIRRAKWLVKNEQYCEKKCYENAEDRGNPKCPDLESLAREITFLFFPLVPLPERTITRNGKIVRFVR